MVQNNEDEVTFKISELMGIIAFNDKNELGYRLFGKINVIEKNWLDFKKETQNLDCYKEYNEEDFLEEFSNIIEDLKDNTGLKIPIKI